MDTWEEEEFMPKRTYIRNEEMKQLLAMVPDLRNMKLSLEAELKRLQAFEKDMDSEYIESATFGNCVLSDMPFSNTNETSDKTGDIAASYQKQITNEAREIKKSIKEVIREKYNIEVVLDKVELGMRSIGESQRKVLELKYFQCYTWNEILRELDSDKSYYSKTQVQRIVKSSVSKLTTITLIDREIYENVISLLEE